MATVFSNTFVSLRAHGTYNDAGDPKKGKVLQGLRPIIMIFA